MFMLDSLIELRTVCSLKVLHGDPVQIITRLLVAHSIDVCAFNADYTPYSIARDNAIREAIFNMNPQRHLLVFDDLYINTPNNIKPYKVFTPYYQTASALSVRNPVKFTYNAKLRAISERSINLESLRKQFAAIATRNGNDLSLVQHGGRVAGLKTMRNFNCRAYANRDMLTNSTSRLGPHLKFGTVSCREVYYACNLEIFRRQLYWRDFYMQIGYHFKVFGVNFRYKVAWKNKPLLFTAWCRGETGYDIVDACMKQLNKSGFMHNRGRMIVASFLTKILHIDWRLGERYFATRLTDYDPFNNNGGWQWSAGTGVDAQPYFRIFNPHTQADKFDPDGAYRRQWLGDNYEAEYANKKKIVDYDKERVVALGLLSK
jgi:deoxyribodipyrimidine photo-lyase